jgi:hypothetical protein
VVPFNNRDVFHLFIKILDSFSSFAKFLKGHVFKVFIGRCVYNISYLVTPIHGTTRS